MNEPQQPTGNPPPEGAAQPTSGAYAPGVAPGRQGGPAAAPQAPPQSRFRDPFQPFDPRRKSPLLACFLSLMPGLGQIYVGYYQRAFTHILVFAGIITVLSMDMFPDLAPMLGIFLAFFVLYNIIDAGRRAAFYNQVLEGSQTPDIPQDMSLPGGGSLPGGIALIVVGSIFLMNTAFDFSLRWLEEWWPMGPILFGAYLVYKAAQDRTKRAA